MKLTPDPREVLPGIRAWRNNNGYVALLLHYSADPDTSSEADRRLSVDDDQKYLREHELDFSSFAGKPVYGEFREDYHVDSNIGYLPSLPVWVGWDFGYHHPAVVFAQTSGSEVWILGELMGEDMTLEQFITKLYAPYVERVFPNARFLHTADPAGRQVSDKSEHTSFSLLANHGIYPYAKKSEINEGLTITRQKIHLNLLKVHPRCRLTIEAFKGGYRYPEPTVGTPEPQYPLKDGFYEHIADAWRYLAVNSMSLIVHRPRVPKPGPTVVEQFLKKREYQDPELGAIS